jgi:hypothetical protein
MTQAPLLPRRRRTAARARRRRRRLMALPRHLQTRVAPGPTRVLPAHHLERPRATAAASPEFAPAPTRAALHRTQIRVARLLTPRPATRAALHRTLTRRAPRRGPLQEEAAAARPAAPSPLQQVIRTSRTRAAQGRILIPAPRRRRRP